MRTTNDLLESRAGKFDGAVFWTVGYSPGEIDLQMSGVETGFLDTLYHISVGLPNSKSQVFLSQPVMDARDGLTRPAP